MSKPIDYDSPRRSGVETDEASAEESAARSVAAQALERDRDGSAVAGTLQLPDADLSGEELTAPVVPMQPDEFRCTRCFLVHHHSRRAAQPDRQDVCQECL